MDDREFYTWLYSNPRILPLFTKFAYEILKSGRKHYGMQALAERVRWHVDIETKGDEFKINNNWCAPLARLLMKMEPPLDGLFRLRARKRQKKTDDYYE